MLTKFLQITLSFVEFNMCTQDVRKWSMCGCTVNAGSVKKCGEEGTDDCKVFRRRSSRTGRAGALTINIKLYQ